MFEKKYSYDLNYFEEWFFTDFLDKIDSILQKSLLDFVCHQFLSHLLHCNLS